MALTFESEILKSAVIIHLGGRFTYDTLPLFKDQVSALLEDEHDYVIVDFEKVRYIDSSGLGALIFLLNTTKQKDKKLIFCALTPGVKHVFNQTKLDKHLTIADNVKQVLKQIKKGIIP